MDIEEIKKDMDSPLNLCRLLNNKNCTMIHMLGADVTVDYSKYKDCECIIHKLLDFYDWTCPNLLELAGQDAASIRYCQSNIDLAKTIIKTNTDNIQKILDERIKLVK